MSEHQTTRYRVAIYDYGLGHAWRLVRPLPGGGREIIAEKMSEARARQVAAALNRDECVALATALEVADQAVSAVHDMFALVSAGDQPEFHARVWAVHNILRPALADYRAREAAP